MRTSQGDVLLPLSTLKRTDAQSVLLNWTQSKVRQTYKQMSGERGQATNSLPMMQHRKYNYSVEKPQKWQVHQKCLPIAGIFSLPICVSYKYFSLFHMKNCVIGWLLNDQHPRIIPAFKLLIIAFFR